MKVKKYKEYLIFILVILLLYFNCTQSSKIVRKSEFDTSEYHIKIGKKIVINTGKNYERLEAELLRRLPKTCILEGNFKNVQLKKEK